jgi:hypothetical protein
MPIEVAKIKNVQVVQDDEGRVYWTSRAAVDADGSNGQNGKPFAYRADDQGLDRLKDAGWPDGDWRNVLLDHGDNTPISDGNGNLYSATTYAWKSRPITTRYVDATTIPYVVVNPAVRRNTVGIVLGCRARVSFDNNSSVRLKAEQDQLVVGDKRRRLGAVWLQGA